VYRALGVSKQTMERAIQHSEAWSDPPTMPEVPEAKRRRAAREMQDVCLPLRWRLIEAPAAGAAPNCSPHHGFVLPARLLGTGAELAFRSETFQLV
jgi:hypothetical protein